MTVVNEPGLYTLILSSRKPEAKAFKRWITHDVIPMIRKTGGYMTDSLLERIQKEPAVIVEFAQALILEKNRVKALECELNTAKPKADYPFLSDAEAQRFGTGKEEIGKCPRCGSPVYVGKGNFYCSNKECSFCLWEDNKFFSSKKKKLTKKIVKELLDKGWCRVTGLYTPKKPQLYDAVIRLDDSGGKYVSFKMEFDR